MIPNSLIFVNKFILKEIIKMKKENLRIFTLSFAIVYIMTASLCVLYRQPLVFSPGYSF